MGYGLLRRIAANSVPLVMVPRSKDLELNRFRNYRAGFRKVSPLPQVSQTQHNDTILSLRNRRRRIKVPGIL